ncbi:MAG: ribonuclease III [Synergistaceae bacterium]|nr:ribonuclease III [Synergistaceae bacterium]
MADITEYSPSRSTRNPSEPAAPDTCASALRSFQERLGYFFRDRELLHTALCHASYSNEQGLAESNERLEFLGDSVLGLAVAHALYEARPGATEGELSADRVDFVCRDALVSWSERLDLTSVLLKGKSLKGATPPSIYADAVEALLGAVYLDGGFDAAVRVIRRHLVASDRNSSLDGGSRDAKSSLQALLQGEALGLPRYEIVSVKGPSHAPRFCVRVFAAGRTWCAEGGSRKAAELEAATLALSALTLPAEQERECGER